MAAVLDVSRIYHSAPSGSWPWVLICAGGIIAFLSLVVGAAMLANLRDVRRTGRGDPWTRRDDQAHRRGTSGRPWEQAQRRHGVDPDTELAAAEAAGAARSARTLPEG